MVPEISAGSLMVLLDFRKDGVPQSDPPDVDKDRDEADPAQRVKVEPKLAWKIETYAEREDGHCEMEARNRVILQAPSESRGQSIFSGINQELILPDILARGIRVLAEPAAHPRKIAEQMVMALQAHHSPLDQKLADAWKRQAVRDERTGF
jgi:hypothetical protein